MGPLGVSMTVGRRTADAACYVIASREQRRVREEDSPYRMPIRPAFTMAIDRIVENSKRMIGWIL